MKSRNGVLKNEEYFETGTVITMESLLIIMQGLSKTNSSIIFIKKASNLGSLFNSSQKYSIYRFFIFLRDEIYSVFFVNSHSVIASSLSVPVLLADLCFPKFITIK